MIMTTYKITRFFFTGEKLIIKTGLTLEEARIHCSDPETSSNTCTKNVEGVGTKWFDGYYEE